MKKSLIIILLACNLQAMELNIPTGNNEQPSVATQQEMYRRANGNAMAGLLLGFGQVIENILEQNKAEFEALLREKSSDAPGSQQIIPLAESMKAAYDNLAGSNARFALPNVGRLLEYMRQDQERVSQLPTESPQPEPVD